MAGTGALDSIIQIWWLAWAAHALPQVHNLFLAHGQNYPFGQNFGVNASMLALGTLFAPVTKLFGPVVTWNILLRLAPAISAASLCLVLRRWTSWWPAAFVGGLLYGFSGYTSHLGLYIFLSFVPIPPLFFLLLHEVFVRQQWRPRRTGTLLGVVCVVQFFISTEILASMVTIGVIAIILLAFTKARRLLIRRWRYAVSSLTCAFGVAALLLFYPAWFVFAGPQHINGPPVPAATWAAFLPTDLLSFITPIGQWFDLRPFSTVGTIFNTSGLLYLGLPLVIIVLFFSVCFHKKKVILLWSALALIACALSLGPVLWVNGHKTGVLLPFAVFEHVPALNGFQAGRFVLYADLFGASVVSLGIDTLWKRLQRRHTGSHVRVWVRSLRAVGVAAAMGALALALSIPLIPRHTVPTTPTNVPTFFSSKAVDVIPPGSVVLAYPYPDLASSEKSAWVPIPSSLLFQAVARMHFTLMGGYGYFAAPSGRAAAPNSPARLKPQSVQILFDVALTGIETPAESDILAHRDITNDLRLFLRNYNVDAVVVAHLSSEVRLGSGVNHLHTPTTVIRAVSTAIGAPTRTHGVTVWLHVKKRLALVNP
jgi:hypothetical protein